MCSKAVAKIILVVFNIAFFILGSVLLALGIFVLLDNETIISIFARLPQEAQDAMANINVPSLLENAAYALIASGGFIFLVAFLGCCGAMKEVKFFLILYAIIVSLVLIIQVAVVVIAVLFQDRMKQELNTYLKKSITEFYIGSGTDNDGNVKVTDDPISLAWDTAQITMQCCGANNYTDYNTATKWNKQYKTTVNGVTYDVTGKVPITCCKVEDPSVFPDKIDQLKFVDVAKCLNNTSAENTNLGGCYDALSDLVQNYAKIAMGIALGTAIVELLGIIAACYLCRAQSKDDI